jgi:hypothetical protein
MKILTGVGRRRGICGDRARQKTSRQALFEASARHANAVRDSTQANQRCGDSVESKLESAFASASGPTCEKKFSTLESGSRRVARA